MAISDVGISEPAGFSRFRQAEQDLWNHYGLEPREEMIDIGGRRVVRVHEVGDGEPVLFVHGTGGSGAYFAPLARELAESFRCILIDRPGWTLSSPIDYFSGDFGAIAADLQRDLLASLGIDRAHLVGGSIGNLYALRLALHHPDRVGNLVLLGGLPADGVTPPVFLRILRSPLGQIIVRLPQKPQMIRKQLAGLGHEKSLDRDEIPGQYITVKTAESRFTDALRNERDLVRCVLAGRGFKPGIVLSTEDLAAIKHRTLMVYGGDDPVGSKDLWEQFTSGMPNAALHVAPDSGHLPWFDDPEGIGHLTLAHLQAPPARSA